MSLDLCTTYDLCGYDVRREVPMYL